MSIRIRILTALLLLVLLAGCVSSEALPVPETPSPSVSLSPSPVSDTSPSPTPMPSPSPTPSPEPDFSTPDVKIQMAGDILLHTKPREAAKMSGGYDFFPYFEYIRDYIDGDLAICNMESPVDAYGDNKKLSSYPTFNVPYEILPALKDAGFTFLTTANNHAYDQRYAGLVKTRENIEKAGLPFTGTNATAEDYDAYSIVELQGIKIGIIAYTDADNGMGVTIPADKLPFAMRRFSTASTESVPAMIADMQRCREAGAEFVILSLHWGAEYRDKPNDTQKEIARLLCEGGADIVLGGHSHCVQPVEWRTAQDGRKCLILYSLGNFFADQIDMDSPIPKTQYGALVSVSIRKNKAGLLEWGDTSYLPTLSYRYKQAATANGFGYRLLPVGDFIVGETRPAVFASDADWKKAQTAFSHVTTVMGDAVPVWAG